MPWLGQNKLEKEGIETLEVAVRRHQASLRDMSRCRHPKIVVRELSSSREAVTLDHGIGFDQGLGINGNAFEVHEQEFHQFPLRWSPVPLIRERSKLCLGHD